MSLNLTPRGERLHIALFGKRNVGKSSLINALTKQEIAVVSDVKGTTTDPVYKAMELLPIGPVVLIDTGGIDDEGALGQLRVEKAYGVLNKTDLALLVIDGQEGISKDEGNVVSKIKEKNIPVIGICNKMDKVGLEDKIGEFENTLGIDVLPVSALKREGIQELIEKIIEKAPKGNEQKRLVGDLLNPGDFVVLVTPIDSAAPKGRLILPQQQVIRDILESDAISVVTKEFELKQTLENLGKKPRIVITDSQVFEKVSKDTPKGIPLTSFSILFARYKGDLKELVKGARALDKLQDGDKILIAEGCTHHTQCDDIGTVKIPQWIKNYLGKDIEFNFCNGTKYPSNVEDYQLIVHCGGCMLNKMEMKHRLALAKEEGISIVNYGVLIAYVQGILDRVIAPFHIED